MRWHHGIHFVQRLQKRGFEILGSGLFSYVLAKPGSSRVIKVYTYGTQDNRDGTKADTDPWPEYVLWAAKNGYAGTHAPRVYSFRVFEGVMGSFYVAVMERLEMTVSQLRSCNHGRYERLYPALRTYRADKEASDAVVPGFYDFYRHFRDAFTHRNTDLHDGNWMVQGDRLVLTDPLSGPGGSTSKRWRVSEQTGVLYQLAA